MSLDQQLREGLESLVEPVDVDQVVASVEARRARRASRRWPRLAAVAAAAVVLVVAGVLGAIRLGDEANETVTAGPDRADGTATTAAALGEVGFTVLWSGQAGDEPMGTLRSATDQAELGELWERATSNPSEGPVPLPSVDFGRQVVVSITIPDDACPPTLERFERDTGTDPVTIEPVFVEPPGGCDAPLIPKTFVVALDLATIGTQFRLRLPGQPIFDYGEQVLEFPTLADAPPARSEEPLSATLELSTTTVEAGGTIEGEVVVRNDTGAPVQVEGCGSPYWVSLSNESVEQLVPRCMALLVRTFPAGESRWPVTISASHFACVTAGTPTASPAGPVCGADGLPPALPPGTYTAQIGRDEGAPAVPDLTVEVTPAS